MRILLRKGKSKGLNKFCGSPERLGVRCCCDAFGRAWPKIQSAENAYFSGGAALGYSATGTALRSVPMILNAQVYCDGFWAGSLIDRPEAVWLHWILPE